MLREGDAVRVVALREPAVQHLIVPNAQRVPRIGDVGTIIEVSGDRYTVEADDGDGEIIWLAAFVDEELELESRFEQS